LSIEKIFNWGESDGKGEATKSENSMGKRLKVRQAFYDSVKR
jgi:hypothetical protein